jgi:DNA invertase Pin-like site-specific DNA recombinase
MSLDFARYREVIPYSRFSSPRQADGTSEARQDDAIDAFAAEHGVILSGRRCIDRGLSGFSGANLQDGALGLLIADLRAGLIPTPALLLIERQDRFGRQPTTSALTTLFTDLLGRGCDLYHLTARRLYSREIIDQDFGALVTLAAEVHSAHHYSAMLSQRMSVVHVKERERMERGEVVRPGAAPRWIDATTDGWVLNAYANTILRLVELSEEGLGQLAVAKALNAEGHVTPRGKPWGPGTVSSVIRSPSVAGGRQHQRRKGGPVLWGYFPAIIQRPRWEALRAAAAARTVAGAAPSHGDPVLFIGRGLTTCAACGRPVGSRSSSYRVRSTGKRVQMFYVRCRGRVTGECTADALPLALVQAHVLTRLRPAVISELLQQPDASRLSRLRLTAERLQAQATEARAMAAAAEREVATALASEPAAAMVIARQVAAAESRAADLEREHGEALLELAALEHGAEASMGAELGESVAQLLRSFASGSVTAAERRAVNRLLRRMGAAIVLESGRPAVGISIGAGEVDWQPISATHLELLAEGRAGVRSVDLGDGVATIDGEWVMLDPVEVTDG